MWAVRCLFSAVNGANIHTCMYILNLVTIESFESFWLSTVADITRLLCLANILYSLKSGVIFPVRVKCFLLSPHECDFLRETLNLPHLCRALLPHCPFFSLSSSFLHFLQALPRTPHLHRQEIMFPQMCHFKPCHQISVQQQKRSCLVVSSVQQNTSQVF